MKLSGQISIFNRVSFVEKLLFTKHLSIMLKSGIPLLESIVTINSQVQNQAFKNVLNKVIQDVEDGLSLHKSLSKFPKIFDPLYINLIRIGDESGNLEENLEYLSDQLKKQYEFRKKLTGALLYPAIVLSAVFIIGFGISVFVLPKLLDLFQSLDVPLPITTQALLLFATIMKNYGVLVLIGVIGLIIGFKIFIDRPSIKPHWHRFLLGIPIFGPFLKDVELALFCRNVGVMLKSGLPITVALQAEYEAATNLVFKEYIGRILKAVEKGKKIAEELSNPHFKYFPLIAVKMIEVGEKTGKLDESLLYLSEFFEDEVDNTSKNFSTILEPIMLLIIGGMVAFVAISIITPIYQFTENIK